MPLLVNNVEVKQQLNDQTHYSRQQIKARKDLSAVFTLRVHVCKGQMNFVCWLLYPSNIRAPMSASECIYQSLVLKTKLKMNDCHLDPVSTKQF